MKLFIAKIYDSKTRTEKHISNCFFLLLLYFYVALVINHCGACATKSSINFKKKQIFFLLKNSTSEI